MQLTPQQHGLSIWLTLYSAVSLSAAVSRISSWPGLARIGSVPDLAPVHSIRQLAQCCVVPASNKTRATGKMV